MHIMEILLNTLLWFIIFYSILGWTLRYYVTKKEREEIREKLDEKIRVIQLERVDSHNLILAYDGENHQFLGQAQDEADLERVIKERFPKNIFIMNERIFTAIKELELQHETTNAR
jgi:hypothetical protein